MICPSCQHQNPDDYKFCTRCGAVLRLMCSNCGAPISPGACFCESCGMSVGGAVAASRVNDVTEGPENDVPISSVIWNAVLGLVIAFVLTYGAITAINWIVPVAGDTLPFPGLQSARAGGIAQNYVNSYYPEFSQAERSVFPAYVEGTDVYIVDFIRHDTSQGLRVLVLRDLSAVWAYEMVEGK